MAKKDKGEEKTNVMRLLDASLIPYTPCFYDPELTSGTDVAAALAGASGTSRTRHWASCRLRRAWAIRVRPWKKACSRVAPGHG